MSLEGLVGRRAEQDTGGLGGGGKTAAAGERSELGRRGSPPPAAAPTQSRQALHSGQRGREILTQPQPAQPQPTQPNLTSLSPW